MLRETFVPEAYLRAKDRQAAERLRNGYSAAIPCSYEGTFEGTKYSASLPTDQCFKMTEPRRWRGIWRNDFEGSRFCLAPTRECTYDTPGDVIWLSFRKSSTYYEMLGRGGSYAVDFVGRRTLHRGTYGHMGGSNHEVVVDRLISMKVLQPPLPPPTKVQMEAWEKECEAAPNCLTNNELKAMGWDIENEMNAMIRKPE